MRSFQIQREINKINDKEKTLEAYHPVRENRDLKIFSSDFL